MYSCFYLVVCDYTLSGKVSVKNDRLNWLLAVKLYFIALRNSCFSSSDKALYIEITPCILQECKVLIIIFSAERAIKACDTLAELQRLNSKTSLHSSVKICHEYFPPTVMHD